MTGKEPKTHFEYANRVIDGADFFQKGLAPVCSYGPLQRYKERILHIQINLPGRSGLPAAREVGAISAIIPELEKLSMVRLNGSDYRNHLSSTTIPASGWDMDAGARACSIRDRGAYVQARQAEQKVLLAAEAIKRIIERKDAEGLKALADCFLRAGRRGGLFSGLLSFHADPALRALLKAISVSLNADSDDLSSQALYRRYLDESRTEKKVLLGVQCLLLCPARHVSALIGQAVEGAVDDWVQKIVVAPDFKQIQDDGEKFMVLCVESLKAYLSGLSVPAQGPKDKAGAFFSAAFRRNRPHNPETTPEQIRAVLQRIDMIDLAFLPPRWVHKPQRSPS